MAAKTVSTKAAKEVKEVKEVVESKVEKNVSKANTFVSIEEITKLYLEFGIGCKNPTAKGNYRIMQGGSSLNIKPTKGYFIYTTDEDFANVSTAGIVSEDVKFEEGTNAQDKKRPNTVICTTLETLKALLGVYARNVNNRVAEVSK